MSNCDTTNNTSHSFPTDVGILALELYFPNQYVDQKELEKFDEVSAGKYTIGLGQDKMGFCSDREDIHSLCLTVTHKLMEKHNIDYKDIGRLEVGTETILDKSKSVKTVLMQLFEKSGNTDIEGVDTTNACYGGTAAVFNAINWIESSSWDGRLALVVAADIAVYASGNARPTGGAGAIGILIGPYAPLVIERGLRSSHSAHVYDFYKPDMESEYARVDGQLSIQCYLSALDKCYQRYKNKATKKNVENISLDTFDGVIFHSPYCKLVQKSLARLLLNDVLSMSEKDVEEKFPALKSLMKVKLEETYFDREVEKLVLKGSQTIFDGKTKPSLLISNQVGNMYTPSVYGGLVSYLLSKASNELCGNRLCLFSYGSGLQASLYSIRITSGKGNEKLAKLLSGISDVPHRLSIRQKIDPKLFSAAMLIREKNHHLAPYEPISDIKNLFPGTYYLASVDEMHRRKYNITAKIVVNNCS